MKNLVFVIESLHLGGAEKSLITVLQNLDYSMYNVDLIVFKEGGLFFNQIPVEVTIIQKEMPPLSVYSRLIYKLKRILKSNNFHNAQLFWPSVEHKFMSNSINYDIAFAYNQGFATYYVSKFIRANKKVAWLNTDYNRAGYNINFDYPFYQVFNELIAVSQEAKNSLLIALSKIKKELEITVIKDILDKEKIIRLAQVRQDVFFNAKKINIVTVGRLAKPKGIHLAVASCKLLIEKGYDINWYVVGEGPERVRLEELISENALSERFFLVGSKENPYPYIKNCDVYVQTSIFEGLGLAVIEAKYLNKPIVATNFDSIYGILDEEETGLIAEMNPQNIAAKIERFITDKSLCHNIITNLIRYENKNKEVSLSQIKNLIES